MTAVMLLKQAPASQKPRRPLLREHREGAPLPSCSASLSEAEFEELKKSKGIIFVSPPLKKSPWLEHLPTIQSITTLLSLAMGMGLTALNVILWPKLFDEQEHKASLRTPRLTIEYLEVNQRPFNEASVEDTPILQGTWMETGVVGKKATDMEFLGPANESTNELKEESELVILFLRVTNISEAPARDITIETLIRDFGNAYTTEEYKSMSGTPATFTTTDLPAGQTLLIPIGRMALDRRDLETIDRTTQYIGRVVKPLRVHFKDIQNNGYHEEVRMNFKNRVIITSDISSKG